MTLATEVASFQCEKIIRCDSSVAIVSPGKAFVPTSRISIMLKPKGNQKMICNGKPPIKKKVHRAMAMYPTIANRLSKTLFFDNIDAIVFNRSCERFIPRNYMD